MFLFIIFFEDFSFSSVELKLLSFDFLPLPAVSQSCFNMKQYLSSYVCSTFLGIFSPYRLDETSLLVR